MEALTLNGQKYVKASKAAKDLGYTSDYVGQLCRSGTVDAHLVGRTWYVNPETLGAHRIEKKRNARVKAREQARKSIEKARVTQNVETKKNYKNIAIRYENDDRELIPEVRKIQIQSHKERVIAAPESTENITYENKNEKIILSGDLTVTDAELEEEYTDTTILKPKIIKKKRVVEDIAAPVKEEIQAVSEESTEVLPHKLTFADKIAAVEELEPEAQPEEVTIVSPTPNEIKSNGGRSILMGILILGIVVLSAASLFIAQRITYATGVTKKEYVLDTRSVQNYVFENKDISSIPFNIHRQ